MGKNSEVRQFSTGKYFEIRQKVARKKSWISSITRSFFFLGQLANFKFHSVIDVGKKSLKLVDHSWKTITKFINRLLKYIAKFFSWMQGKKAWFCESVARSHEIHQLVTENTKFVNESQKKKIKKINCEIPRQVMVKNREFWQSFDAQNARISHGKI